MGRGWERAALIAALETLALAALLLVLASGGATGLAPARSSAPAGPTPSWPATWTPIPAPSPPGLPVVLLATQTPWPSPTADQASATPRPPTTPRLVTPTMTATLPSCTAGSRTGEPCRWQGPPELGA